MFNNSDNMQIIQILNGEQQNYGPGAAVVDDCLQLVSEFPKICFIAHCPREANAVAHELAQ